jgi:hypothetical protein
MHSPFVHTCPLLFIKLPPELVIKSDEACRFSEEDVTTVRRVGHGASGVVWEGTLNTDGRKVAVKFVKIFELDESGDLVNPDASVRGSQASLLFFFFFFFALFGSFFLFLC